MSKKRILLVEDDLKSRFLYSDALRNAGFAVDTSSHGLEALEMIENFAYDLVITDVHMPILTGIDFYSLAVRKSPRLRERFVFISGDPAKAAEFSPLIKNYFIKPFKIADLIECVRAILERMDRGPDAEGNAFNH